MSQHSRRTPIDYNNRQIILWYFEGMNAALEEQNLLYPGLANVRPLTNPKDLINSFTGGGLYAQHGEWQEADTYEPGSGWQIGFTPRLYKNAFQVNDWSNQYDDKGFWQAQSQLLGAYGIQSLDHIFVNMLNNGFSGSYNVYDGVPLFSTSHVLKNAPGVFSNKSASNTTLDATNLAAALTYFMNIPNDDGIAMSMTPRLLIVHPNRVLAATQLLTSLSPLDAPNENVKSMVANKLMVVSNPKLTSTLSWFVSTSPSEIKGMGHGLDLWFTPKGRPQTKRYIKEDPDGYKVVGAFQVAPTITKVRGVYGNAGA